MSFDPRNTISVTGTGTASAAPDVARLRIAVEQTRTLIGDALRAAEDDATTVGTVAREAGLEDAGIASGRLSLNQEWGDGGAADIRGYTARQAFTLTARNLHIVGPLVSSLGERLGSALRIDDLSVEIGDPAPLRVQARERAMQAARSQAEALARLAGRELGGVIVIETDAEASHDEPSSRMLMMGSGFSPEAGAQEVSASIRVVFELL